MTSVVMPSELLEKIREFLSQGKTGNFTIDVKEGQILSWKIAEHGRVCKVDKNGGNLR